MKGKDPLIEEARLRHEAHVNHPTHRPLSINYELVGLRGEEALASHFDLEVDMVRRLNGDGGTDNFLCLDGVDYPVDVKCARKPFNLIVERGKVRKGKVIYILAKYLEDIDAAVLLRWEWGATIKAAPTRDFGYGVINHYISVNKLRDLIELEVRHTPRSRINR